MTRASLRPAMGRPREFDMQAALEAALLVFWRNGYAATSLDDLTAAMKLSRSSFYGAFGSKHNVLLAAVRHYVDGIFAKLQSHSARRDNLMDALRAIIHEIAGFNGSSEDGCLLVNSVTELAPDDRELCEIAQMHISRVLALIADLLRQAGHPNGTAEHLAGALLSCAFGATTLRKAKLPATALRAFVSQVERLLIVPEHSVLD